MSAAKLLLTVVPTAAVLTAALLPVNAEEWNTRESRARWAELSTAIFGAGAKVEKTDRLVTLEAPATAQDAALVPVAIQMAPDLGVKELDLVIDQNPSPLAAKVRFGTAGDARQMKFRVRVDGFTNVHAVAATRDGKLLQNAIFVQAAGGCSAPMGMSEAEALSHMGEMKMKFGTNARLDNAPQATLMIRHPNFNGMQMDQAKHQFTPARFIKSISVARGEEIVFTMTTDISLSTNPVIEFVYKAESIKPFRVIVADTAGATWTQQFDPPQPMH